MSISTFASESRCIIILSFNRVVISLLEFSLNNLDEKDKAKTYQSSNKKQYEK